MKFAFLMSEETQETQAKSPLRLLREQAQLTRPSSEANYWRFRTQTSRLGIGKSVTQR
jgi:hypothetical protein